MKYVILALVSMLAACSPNPDTPMKTQSYNAPDVDIGGAQRVVVTRIGVFRDDLAYGSRRGIYIIKDKDTGKEYLGISGVGISETGSHSVGKSSTADER